MFFSVIPLKERLSHCVVASVAINTRFLFKSPNKSVIVELLNCHLWELSDRYLVRYFVNVDNEVTIAISYETLIISS